MGGAIANPIVRAYFGELEPELLRGGMWPLPELALFLRNATVPDVRREARSRRFILAEESLTGGEIQIHRF